MNQRVKLFPAQTNLPLFTHRNGEPTVFEPFRTNDQPRPIPPQYLDAIAAPVAEQKQIAGIFLVLLEGIVA